MTLWFSFDLKFSGIFLQLFGSETGQAPALVILDQVPFIGVHPFILNLLKTTFLIWNLAYEVILLFLKFWLRILMNATEAHVFSQINDTWSLLDSFFSTIISASSFPLTKSRIAGSMSLEDCTGCQIRSQMPCDFFFFRSHFMSDTKCHREGAHRIAPFIVGDNMAVGVRAYLDIPQPELDTGNLHNQRKTELLTMMSTSVMINDHHCNGQIIMLWDCLLCLTTKD